MDCPRALSFRPRVPRASPLYQLVQDHFEELKCVYAERFEATCGPWQEHWTATVEAFMRCGDWHFGFARVWCFTCKHSFLTAFSCGARAFCPSCEAKRRALWTEHLLEDVLPRECSFRMLVFTVPRCIRPTLMRRRSLLGVVSRIAYETTLRLLERELPGVDGLPYFVSSLQLWGNSINSHPHLHCLVSLALKSRDGTLHHLPERLDLSPLAEEFRRRVLAALRRRDAISKEHAARISSWEHSGGFSADGSVMIPAGDSEALERVTAYILRPPLSLSRLTYVPGSSTAIYRTPDTPVTGGNFITLDAKELLVRLLCLVPRPGECLIRYYGAASSTWRRAPPTQPIVEEGGAPAPPAAARPNRRSGSWARMLKRVYGIDPLVCPRCSSKMSVIAFITEGEVIEILHPENVSRRSLKFR